LIGRADWNDCLNLNCFSTEPGQSFQTTTNKEGQVAESILIGAMYVLSAQEMAAIADEKGLADQAEQYRAAATQMTATVLEHGWDGDWFLRAYDDYGNAVGSNQREEGKIFIEPQGFCALAGIGVEDGKVETALRAVHERLATPHGILLLQPAFSQYYLHLGEISSYPPGYKENASVFCHTNPWIMIAETILGHGDLAHDYYTRINPSAREAISDVHRSEPYVYAQMIAGRDAPTEGEAKNSWLSGTAAWNYVAIAQWILGIRPTYQGLQIAPVIPVEWPGFSATRVYRGTTYHITVTRAGPGNNVSLWVGGKTVQGNIVPPPQNDVTEVNVEVTLS
jgi:cellobiose phosphorylase